MNRAGILKIKENMEQVLVGQSRTIDLVLTALLAKGHILLEDMPGTGKTKMADSIAKSMQVEFKRIQFTPDLLPTDIVGLHYFNPKESEFVFKKGPVFSNIVLADELNRATPKTQSSLLECMAETQVTIDGETRELSSPFLVIATQNPIETLGTYPLPEAQLDRFMMRISMEETSREMELDILQRYLLDQDAVALETVIQKEEVLTCMEEVKGVFVHTLLLEYITDLVMATRTQSAIETGVSKRGSLALLYASKAYAYMQGRTYVVPEDIKFLAIPILAHRIRLFDQYSGVKGQEKVISQLLEEVKLVTEDWGAR